jgi:hypothetical protein
MGKIEWCNTDFVLKLFFGVQVSIIAVEQAKKPKLSLDFSVEIC